MCLYNEAIINHVLPDDLHLPLLKTSALPLQLTAPALALLLVFRTNASYGRFDEARKMWGAMLNRIRDLARQMLSYMDNDEDREQALRYLMAFPYAFKDHMLREDDLVKDMQNVGLSDKEIEILTSTEHRPNYCLQVISQVLSKNTDITDFQRINMDHNLTHFHDQVGGCERIFKTPLPLSYTRLTSRFLVLWHCFLPLALWDACNWMVVPATFMSAAALFCIEEVGVLIEEPFSILALHAIASTAEKNVRELTRLQDNSLNWQAIAGANQPKLLGESSQNGVSESLQASAQMRA
jgi:predicted membrane chloride channel (bestrophin family)